VGIHVGITLRREQDQQPPPLPSLHPLISGNGSDYIIDRHQFPFPPYQHQHTNILIKGMPETILNK